MYMARDIYEMQLSGRSVGIFPVLCCRRIGSKEPCEQDSTMGRREGSYDDEHLPTAQHSALTRGSSAYKNKSLARFAKTSKTENNMTTAITM